jgi:hypothetical protein
MNFKKFNEIAELFGIVALIASLVFVGLELRQSQIIATVELEAANSSASIQMASLINDSSEVWGRGISGEELNAADFETFMTIIIAQSDRNFSLQYQLRILGQELAADHMIHDFAIFLHERPGARKAWSQREFELKQKRALVDEEQDLVTSKYVTMVMADFKVLDQIDN